MTSQQAYGCVYVSESLDELKNVLPLNSLFSKQCLFRNWDMAWRNDKLFRVPASQPQGTRINIFQLVLDSWSTRETTFLAKRKG